MLDAIIHNPYVLSSLATLCALIAHHIARYGLKIEPVRLSPDGQQYMAMARGEDIKMPYGLRWLMPSISGLFPHRWHAIVWCIMTWAALIALGPLTIYYMPRDASLLECWVAVVLVIGLPGVFRVNAMLPVLADGMGMALMLLCSGLMRHGYPVAGVSVSLISGTIRETTPIFSAVTSWSWWPLIGLLYVGLRWLQLRKRKGGLFDLNYYSRDGEAFVRGLKGALPGLNGHGHRFLLGVEMLLPWGACLVVSLEPTQQIGLALLLSYAQLAHGMDKSRLYQWAFPPVVAKAAQLLCRHPRWIGPVLLAHIFHPWNDKCV